MIGGTPRITDTRDGGDDRGYRAVHVVILFDEMPVEIQIRTPLQQAWAQAVERVDQLRGWDLKHGVGPPAWLDYFRVLGEVFQRAEEIEDVQSLDIPPFPDEPAHN